MNILELIGQVFGILAVLLGFLSYQVKNDKQLMLMQTLTSAVFVIHYYLLGAIPGAVLNIVCIVRNMVYYCKDKKFYKPRLYPILFAVIMFILGIYSSNGIHSVFVVAGLVISTVCFSFKEAQNVRKSVLVTCPMVLIYDVIERSYGGVIYESVAIISAIVGIIRYNKNKKA